MLCELPHCFSRIYSVNDNGVILVLGLGFFPFVEGDSVSSMLS